MHAAQLDIARPEHPLEGERVAARFAGNRARAAVRCGRFPAVKEPHFVMWHDADTLRPSVAEMRGRLEFLHENGESDVAFGQAHLPRVKPPHQARCA